MQIPANTPDEVRVFIVKHLDTLISIRRRQARLAGTKTEQRATDLDFIKTQLEQSYIVQRP